MDQFPSGRKAVAMYLTGELVVEDLYDWALVFPQDFERFQTDIDSKHLASLITSLNHDLVRQEITEDDMKAALVSSIGWPLLSRELSTSSSLSAVHYERAVTRSVQELQLAG